MKKILIWSGAILVLIIAGIAIARADGRGWHGWCHRGWGYGPLGYVAHELSLNDAQKSQVKSIWQMERPAISSLVHEFAAESKEMDSVTVQDNLDESKVREIADRQGSTVAKLLVERERLKSQIYGSVLTPEQRTKADELQARWHSRLDRIADRLGSAAEEK
jgi:Spy/CpxP family protein refolding chaperone